MVLYHVFSTWRHLGGHCITFSPLEGTLEGTVSHFVHWMDTKGHFGMFCPLEGHLKGHCITFSPLEGHSRGHFIMFYVMCIEEETFSQSPCHPGVISLNCAVSICAMVKIQLFTLVPCLYFFILWQWFIVLLFISCIFYIFILLCFFFLNECLSLFLPSPLLL